MTVTAIIVGILVTIAFIIPMLSLMKKREKSHSDRVMKGSQKGQNGPDAA